MLSGKGYFIHYVSRLGDLDIAAEQAVTAGIEHVIVKVLDGTSRYENVVGGVDLVQKLVDAFRPKGIQIWGFQAVYGNSYEAAVALSMINKFNFDGWVIDAEGAMKGKHSAARQYMLSLRPNTDKLIALSSYRYPKVHPQDYWVNGVNMGFPWREYFANGVDINMPQVYWEQAHNPAYQLNVSVQQFEDLYVELAVPHAQIVPTGAAYENGGWSATPADVENYLKEAKALVAQNRIYDAVNFWEWYYAQQKTNTWPVIAAFQWDTSAPTPNAPYAIGVGKVLASGGLTIRTAPTTSGLYRGAFGLNATPYIFEHYVKSANEEWVRVGDNLWSAMKYNGVTYMRWEKKF